MKLKYILLSFLFALGSSCQTNQKKDSSQHRIKIEWVEKVEGDFSFKEKWSYPEYVYKNRHGQISCDGYCPPRAEKMKGPNGKIYQDSLTEFYKIIDTTHIFHSIQSEANVYENTVYDHFEFKKMDNGTLKGKTVNTVSGYSHLHIKLKNDSCYAWNEYNSIFDGGNHLFYANEGRILIDKSLYKQGIVKADFDFRFTNTLEVDEELSWKGKIYSKISPDKARNRSH
jgi:hypothetical protein